MASMAAQYGEISGISVAENWRIINGGMRQRGGALKYHGSARRIHIKYRA